MFPLPSFSNFTITPKAAEAYQQLLKLRLPAGRALLQQAFAEKPDNKFPWLISSYADAIELIVSEDESLYKRLQANEQNTLDGLRSGDANSPYYLYSQAEVKLQWAFVKLKFGDEASAALNIKQAYNLLEENSARFPSFSLNKKPLGVLHILLGSVPEKYMWVVKMVGMHGNVTKGLQELQDVARENEFFSFEASLLRSVAEFYILGKEKVEYPEVKQLYLTHKDNLLVTFIFASALMKTGRNDEAVQTLQSRPSGKDYLDFPFMEYMEGDADLRKGLYESSRQHYNNFISQSKGKNYLKDAYYKIFAGYWLSNQDQQAKEALGKVLTNGRTLTDGDKYAQKIAQSKEYPHKLLLKARLLSDGGYYEQALEVLKPFKPEKASAKDQVEYYYRKARINHITGNHQEAIALYLKVVTISGRSTDYFAPNSALQLGYIYKLLKNYSIAEQYFRLALSYKDYEYKNSIDNKAKAALQEIKGIKK